ncbi:binding-protein-dependent transport systems inner membrane component [Alkaliphilus metalliredigens QYMF]|uniref:Binding-protein-dependent transport systems inner membrane component n=1 Tax=Alkaliphilus metalliredigens (strain QYMF) TaxID=293826 RepID=A6TRZ1_ALKMQ|nr:proline/glycine betaine ABC transporter permease [Alkaliphilus metalliredigens]ABR48959.1 binding-protein-dependent transport systems inner membrane component [Alkaliphilus metalliredigens QYMF]
MISNNLLTMWQQKLPIGDVIESFIDFLTTNFRFVFRQISERLDWALTFFEEDILLRVPPLLLILLIALLAWRVASKGVGIFSFLGLLLVYNLGLWVPTMSTLSMVLTSTVISIMLGIPIGILIAKNQIMNRIIMPIMDLMQTMPAFVYLIPAVSFFRMGKVPGIFATVIFSIAPCIRLTNLGIRQVPEELIEAADAFGSTGAQKLMKVQFPLALSTIMAGVNQTIMLSLSMVVISAMIGAGGLGREVWHGIQRLQVGSAFEAGIAVVILAMILDRITQSIAIKNKKN